MLSRLVSLSYLSYTMCPNHLIRLHSCPRHVMCHVARASYLHFPLARCLYRCVSFFISPLCFPQAWWLLFPSPPCFPQAGWLLFTLPPCFPQAWWCIIQLPIQNSAPVYVLPILPFYFQIVLPAHDPSVPFSQ